MAVELACGGGWTAEEPPPPPPSHWLTLALEAPTAASAARFALAAAEPDRSLASGAWPESSPERPSAMLASRSKMVSSMSSSPAAGGAAGGATALPV